MIFITKRQSLEALHFDGVGLSKLNGVPFLALLYLGSGAANPNCIHKLSGGALSETPTSGEPNPQICEANWEAGLCTKGV